MILWVFIEPFGVKIVITYRYFTDIYRYFIDIFSEIPAQTHVIYSRDFSPIFPLIDFSSAFSFRCLLKTDFSAIYRSKKLIFLSLYTSKSNSPTVTNKCVNFTNRIVKIMRFMILNKISSPN